jgi:hypothetical protein
LLQDFADFGGATPSRAGCSSSVAPKSNAFETYPASERMYNLMNHELIHGAAILRSTGPALAAVFLGRSLLIWNPESIVASYHDAAPRRPLVRGR